LFNRIPLSSNYCW